MKPHLGRSSAFCHRAGELPAQVVLGRCTETQVCAWLLACVPTRPGRIFYGFTNWISKREPT